ncbi:unnamed protein product [marine sediment metagenome]|uniref:Uncharacterized protein n=1 Tax=marine sediment metagenome TaxID=412755 RepID=X1KTR3_9ZZZZ
MIKMINKKTEIKKYKENSILKPYLIHIENEVMNILNLFETDKLLRELYKSHNYNIFTLINNTKQFLNRIRKVISIL